MSDQDDMLTSLVSATPNTAQGVAAMVAALRRNQDLGGIAKASGLSNLSSLGDDLLKGTQEDIKQAGTQAQTNVSEQMTQQRHQDQMQRYDDQNAAAIRQDASRNRIADMEDQTRRDIATGKLNKTSNLDPSDQSMVDGILHYNSPLPSSRSGRNANIIDAVYEQNPQYDSTKFGQKQKAQQYFGSGQGGTLVKNAGVALQHLDTLDNASQGMANTAVSPLNSAINVGKNMFGGGPDLAAFNTAKGVVSSEIEKFIIGGPSALQDRKDLQSQLADADTPAKVQAVTNTLRTLMAGQMHGLKGQFEDNGLGDFSTRVKDNNVRKLLGMDELPTTGPMASPGQAFKTVQPQDPSGFIRGQQAPPQSSLPSATGYNQQGMINALKGNLTAGGGGGTSLPGALQTAQGGPSAGQQTPIPVRSMPQEVPGVTIVKTGKRNGKRVAQLSDGRVVDLD